MKGKKWDEESHPVTWLHEVKPDHLLRVLCGQIRKTKKTLCLKNSSPQIRIDDQYFSSILIKIRNFFDINFELKSKDTKE